MAPVSVVVPVPICWIPPVPEITPLTVPALSLRLKISVPLSTTFPTMLPEVPPLPSCKAPAEIVVPPV
ncbi:outer membrane autotransporter barrel 6 domain protein [Burkholderia pseudomallei]|nr:outer membrane autotransporter barrel 6 domain protein [Burkholderia pseudomallei]